MKICSLFKKNLNICSIRSQTQFLGKFRYSFHIINCLMKIWQNFQIEVQEQLVSANWRDCQVFKLAELSLVLIITSGVIAFSSQYNAGTQTEVNRLMQINKCNYLTQIQLQLDRCPHFCGSYNQLGGEKNTTILLIMMVGGTASYQATDSAK